MPISRRSLLISSSSLFDQATAPRAPSAFPPGAGRLRIVVTGGHPGDPECGCGGTIARYTNLGHDVVLLYLNRGEGFCKGSDPTECGVVRTAEAQKACQILKAQAKFIGQYDGRSAVDISHYDECRRVLTSEKPDIVFTQWPIDRHRDHRALSMMILDAWLIGGKAFALYYYEVSDDTMMFLPNDFVDIASVESQRRAACYAHASQEPDKWYPGQVKLTTFRGVQSGAIQAEGFTRHWESKRGFLP